MEFFSRLYNFIAYNIFTLAISFVLDPFLYLIYTKLLLFGNWKCIFEDVKLGLTYYRKDKKEQNDKISLKAILTKLNKVQTDILTSLKWRVTPTDFLTLVPIISRSPTPEETILSRTWSSKKGTNYHRTAATQCYFLSISSAVFKIKFNSSLQFKTKLILTF